MSDATSDDLPVHEGQDEPKTTEERNEDSEKTQDQEVNQDIKDDEG